MKRKAYRIFFCLMLLLCTAVFSIRNVLGGAEYVTAAGRQSIYELNVAKTRGAIYDCHLVPLTGAETVQVAAVAPTIESIGALEKATEGKNRKRLAAALENGKPFSMELTEPVEDNCIDLFRVQKRYEEDQLAPHIIGYTDAGGNGVSGIEYAMDDLLSQSRGEITLYYRVDALGRVIAGANRRIVNTIEDSQAGVALTLDSEIQKIVENASKRLQKGAVVVTEVPNGEIRGIASVPSFSPYDLGKASKDPDSPLLNRAFSAYSPGSVFKLVTAAQQIEQHGDTYDFVCTGSINAGGMLFHCFDGDPHGKVNLQTALEKSCNCYFISAARALGSQSVLEMAYNLGFGASMEFGRGLYSDQGVLPGPDSLENARALANFSFGQGELTVTPLQVAGMINAIASGGEYSSPKLIEGTVDREQRLTPAAPANQKKLRVMKRSTALKLQEYLESTARQGTGQAGAPTGLTCGIKTGTAQTGSFQNGQELLHFWYTGYLCDEGGPRYTVTVLRESVLEDNGVTAGVFREIASALSKLPKEE